MGTVYSSAPTIAFFPKKQLVRFIEGENADELMKAEKASRITLQALRNVTLKSKLMSELDGLR